MMSQKIILITGFARSGKDTVAKAMLTYNPKYASTSFAEPLKFACNTAMRELSTDVDFFKEEDKVAYRDVLIAVGKAARDKKNSVFADMTSKRVGKLISVGFSPVITDWRYLNEYEVLADNFGAENVITVFIQREGYGPAHQEELKSISKITESLKLTYEKTFEDGAVDDITKWGFDIAQEHIDPSKK